MPKGTRKPKPVRRLDCVGISSTHSSDTVTLYGGYEEPWIICGYHASWGDITKHLSHPVTVEYGAE